MKNFSISPREFGSSLWRNRALIIAMTKRDVIGRYKGSMMGILWSFFNPLFMLAVYTFVFSMVFHARWSTTVSGSKTEFALILFSGLIVFNIFAECINRAPMTILGNANYVKKVVFPLEILPWVTMGSVLFHAAVSLGVWLFAYLIFFGLPHLTILLIPIVILPLIFFSMGISWAFAALGVYIRDISQFVGILTTVILFLSPIFYPLSAVPKKLQNFLLLNPLAPTIEQTRDILFFGKSLNWTLLLLLYIGSIVIAWLGFAWFQKTRKGFADVL